MLVIRSELAAESKAKSAEDRAAALVSPKGHGFWAVLWCAAFVRTLPFEMHEDV